MFECFLCKKQINEFYKFDQDEQKLCSICFINKTIDKIDQLETKKILK